MFSTESLIGFKGVKGFQLEDDPTNIYRGWFGYKGKRDANIVVISPYPSETQPNELDEILMQEQRTLGIDAQPTLQPALESATNGQQEFDFKQWYLCPKSLVVRSEDGPCPLTNDPKRFRVRINDRTKTDKKQNTVGDQGCPCCGEKDRSLLHW